MESKNHICNKIMVNSFEDFLKSAIASCILIEKYQGYFVRNIFKAASAFRSSFNKNESRFLLCLSDNLHNVPELAELFIETVRMWEDCESEDEITELIKRTKENFLLFINLQLCISSMMHSASYLFPSMKDSVRIPSKLCLFQALLNSLSDLCSISIATANIFIAYLNLTNPQILKR